MSTERDTADLRAILRGDDFTARAFLRLVVHPADVVESLRAVEPDEWPRLLRLIPDTEIRAEVITELDEGERDLLFEHLDARELGPLLREMESDDAADIVGELEPDDARDALVYLEDDDRADVERLLTYPEDSAGGIMQVERAQVHEGALVQDAIEKVRDLHEEGVDVHVIWVVGDADNLLGYVDLAKLVIHGPTDPIASIVEPVVAEVTPLVDQEEVAAIFVKYDVVSLPVVDDNGAMLGRIMFDDIVDVLTEEADEDALRQAGTDAEELLYRDRAFPIARVRLPWIGINLFGSLISAFLLHLFEPVIVQVVLIASFVPVITAMGGNVGTQSATIITRGIATNRIGVGDVMRTIFREFRVGILMGLICGTTVSIIAVVFFGHGNLYLGLVVFFAMVSAMTTAAVVGSVAPAAMFRFGIDPAIASGPFVTTANDISGIVIYMSTALFFIENLKA